MRKLQFVEVSRDLLSFATDRRLILAFLMLVVLPYSAYVGVSQYALDELSQAVRATQPHVATAKVSVLGFTGIVEPGSSMSLSLMPESRSRLEGLFYALMGAPIDLNGNSTVVALTAILVALSVVYELGSYCFAALAFVWIYGVLRGESWGFADVLKLTWKHNMWYYLGYAIVGIILVAIVGKVLRDIFMSSGARSLGLAFLLPIGAASLLIFVRYALWGPSIVIEEAGIFGSLRRSFDLTQGNALRLLGLFLVFGLLPGLLTLAWFPNIANRLTVNPDSLLTSLGIEIRWTTTASLAPVTLQLIGELIMSLMTVLLLSVVYARLRQYEEEGEQPEPLSDTDRAALANFASRD